MSLAEKITKTPVRERVIVDCCALIDQEVSATSGLSGLAVKGAYKMVKAIKPRFVPEVVIYEVGPVHVQKLRGEDE